MDISQEKRRAAQVSGISNVTYDLLAILTSKLEGVAALEEYKDDAKEAGDQEAQRLFERFQQREAEDVAQLKPLVQRRLG